MFGCCGHESKKFRKEDGKIDHVRFARVAESARKAGLTDQQVERIAQCRCPCHTDGVVCMC